MDRLHSSTADALCDGSASGDVASSFTHAPYTFTSGHTHHMCAVSLAVHVSLCPCYQRAVVAAAPAAVALAAPLRPLLLLLQIAVSVEARILEALLGPERTPAQYKETQAKYRAGEGMRELDLTQVRATQKSEEPRGLLQERQHRQQERLKHKLPPAAQQACMGVSVPAHQRRCLGSTSCPLQAGVFWWGASYARRQLAGVCCAEGQDTRPTWAPEVVICWHA